MARSRTGANKGIGFETARQLIELGQTVYLGVRLATLGPDGPTGTLQDELGALHW